jgi:N-acyl-D-aspartate/D-glutamate deacylase
MTLGPAQRLQRFVPAMRTKGRLSPGADADITVFDPLTVIDRATLKVPEQTSVGMVHVIVNGQFVVRNSAFCEGVLPGRAIRGGSLAGQGTRLKRQKRTTTLFASLLEGQEARFLGFDC